MFLNKQKLKKLFHRKSLKDKKGTGDFIFPVYMILFCVILVSYGYQKQIIHFTKTHIEDSIAAATLASACINPYEYGTFNEMSYEIVNSCYDLFVQSFKENMKLDDTLTPLEHTFSDTLITKSIEITEYSYYCLRDNIIYKTTYGGNVNMEMGELGAVETPDGNLVKETTIYAEILVTIQNPVTKEEIPVTKSFTVDIVKSE